MPTEPIALIGAGGHAKVVYDAMVAAGLSDRVRVMDDDPRRHGARFFDLQVQAPLGQLDTLPLNVHVAVGENRIRREVSERVVAAGKRLVAVVHPRAQISPLAEVGLGAFVAALAVVAPHATVRECAIINHAAIVDHDCVVGSWAHVAPGATLGGGVKVGTGALVGAGAVILPGVAIGEWAVVGAGAVVTRAVPNGATVVGAPARAIRDA